MYYTSAKILMEPEHARPSVRVPLLLTRLQRPQVPKRREWHPLAHSSRPGRSTAGLTGLVAQTKEDYGGGCRSIVLS